jgi:hypothetical protein
VHWAFQQHLNQPHREDDRLVFTSGHPFGIHEATAWWQCYDALRNADREIREVDALLADAGQPRFAVRSIAGVDVPSRLAELIPVDGWMPVDARVQVSDIPRLVQNLGGTALYGRDFTVPLRELIQNAADAVRARRKLQQHPDDWSAITVRTGQDSNGAWIEVEDMGLGMSDATLTGAFLDFGKTSWGSLPMQQEWPGLLASGFIPTGQYGIGFFSVFMWGKRARVTTRRYRDAFQDTRVLEFGAALGAPPLLRPATDTEWLQHGGTQVRVWFDDPATLQQMLSRHGRPGKLRDLCAWLCPTLDVDLLVEEDGVQQRAISASDWLTLEGQELLRRIIGIVGDPKHPYFKYMLARWGSNLQVIRTAAGEPLGRACVVPNASFTFEEEEVPHSTWAGVVTVGGFRASRLGCIIGVMLGSSLRASRDAAEPLAWDEALATWASDQARCVHLLTTNSADLQSCAETVRLCGGNTQDLPVARSSRGWLSTEDIARMREIPSEIGITDMHRETEGGVRVHPVQPQEHVMFTRIGYPGLLLISAVNGSDWPLRRTPFLPATSMAEIWWRSARHTLAGAVAEAVCKAWGEPLERVLVMSKLTGRAQPFQYLIGYRGNEPVLDDPIVLRRSTRDASGG